MQSDGDKTFDVSNAKMKGKAKACDMVKVKYMEIDGKMLASWVGVDKTTKMETTTTTKTKEKPRSKNPGHIKEKGGVKSPLFITRPR